MNQRVNRFLRGVALLAAFLLLVPPLAGCSDSERPAVPDEPKPKDVAAAPRIIILLSLDTVRADVLGTYGYPRFTSPVLDVLAAEGVLFEDASATAPWTLPSHASMLTGLYPLRHGVTTMRTRLLPEVPTVAGILRANGFETAAIVNSTWLKQESFQLTRDFEKYRFIKDVADQRAPSALVTDQAIAWIEEAADAKLFLFVHYYDAHSDYSSEPAYEKLFVEPYDGIADGTSWQLVQANLDEAYVEMCHRDFDPAKCRFGSPEHPKMVDASIDHIDFDEKDARHLKNLYDAGIRQLDTELGRFFAWLRARGLLDQVLLVVTSDHGEEFLEHGQVDHFIPTWQEILHVPLIFRGAGVPAGVRVATPVSSVDIVPTLLGLAGVPLPDGAVDGLDLRPLWGGGAPRVEERFEERFLYGEASGGLTYDFVAKGFYPIYQSARRGRFKLVSETKSGTQALYDLSADPRERVDVSASHPEIVQMLAAELKKRALSSEPSPESDVELGEEDLERLRALGYVQ